MPMSVALIRQVERVSGQADFPALQLDLVGPFQNVSWH